MKGLIRRLPGAAGPQPKKKNFQPQMDPARRCRNQSSYPVNLNVNLNEFVFYIHELAGTSKKIF